ncbi:hypothetical protein HYS03_01190 [Candidatus Woesebacteria bacterium]|nr:hypothetical protein [Candidatus Woesebacteria bacterium]QQG47774.1 MAG: hypothetical protein HY044_01650 [Candidatus Woesebacteria bacterium]
MNRNPFKRLLIFWVIVTQIFELMMVLVAVHYGLRDLIADGVVVVLVTICSIAFFKFGEINGMNK